MPHAEHVYAQFFWAKANLHLPRSNFCWQLAKSNVSSQMCTFGGRCGERGGGDGGNGGLIGGVGGERGGAGGNGGYARCRNMSSSSWTRPSNPTNGNGSGLAVRRGSLHKGSRYPLPYQVKVPPPMNMYWSIPWLTFSAAWSTVTPASASLAAML